MFFKLFSQPWVATFFHIPAIPAEAGLPFHINNCSSCTAKEHTRSSSPPGHQPKRPLDRRFWHNQNPWPSYIKILIDVFRLFRKTNTYPEKGSILMTLLHTPASPSIPLRKSTASTASRIRICGVICINAFSPKTLWQSQPPSRSRHLSDASSAFPPCHLQPLHCIHQCSHQAPFLTQRTR